MKYFPSSYCIKYTISQKHIKVIGFDADDTLWVNEPFYQAFEKQFGAIQKPYLEVEEASRELFKTEIQNL